MTVFAHLRCCASKVGSLLASFWDNIPVTFSRVEQSSVSLSLSLFFLWSPLCLIYLFCLAHFVDAVTYEKQLLYFHIVDILHHIYITFIYNIILFLSILFSSNALFTYTGKNVLLKFGILCSLFFGLDKHLRYFECPVALWSVITEAHPCLQYQGCYLLLTANNSPN